MPFVAAMSAKLVLSTALLLVALQGAQAGFRYTYWLRRNYEHPEQTGVIHCSDSGGSAWGPVRI